MDSKQLCCRMCRQKVSRVTDPDGVTWYGHPGAQGHEVVPVFMPSADVIHVCDFCLVPHPRWVFPLLEHATTQLFRPDIGVTAVAVDTDAWWGACEECADLITNRKIGKLRDRALAVLKERLPDVSRQELAWARESVLLQLAAFWQASPGAPVEAGTFS